MSGARIKTSRLADVSNAYRGIVVLYLGDGTTVRATSETVRAILALPIERRVVAYDVDSAGNRYNPRLAADADLRANLANVQRSTAGGTKP